MESKKNGTNELIYKKIQIQNRNRLTDVANKLLVTRAPGWGEINWNPGVDIYTLICIK